MCLIPLCSTFRRLFLGAAGLSLAAGLTAPAVRAADESSPRVGINFTAAGVVNGASFLGGSDAPGEIVSIFGTDIGPSELTTLEVSGGKVTTQLGGVRVLFDGVPAPLVFVLDTQLSAIVPYAVAGRQTSGVTIEFGGNSFGPVTVPVALVSPGLFSLNASGGGQGAILNEDGSVNSPQNQADRGSIVVLFATGEGVTEPAGEDGLIAVGTLPKPLAEVSVEIGGEPAEILYAGAAPSLVAGVLQVNARMSGQISGGAITPVRLSIGGVQSQDGITLAVRGQATVLPGQSVPLTPITFGEISDLGGGVLNDSLLDFQFKDASEAAVLDAKLQDRVVISTNRGTLIFAPRIGDVDDFGSGAVVFRIDISGFGSTKLEVAYRTDGLGDVAPTSAERSADGDTLSLIYDPPIAAPQESLFPSIFTDATEMDFSGSMTIHARLPDSTELTTKLDNTASPK